MSNFCLSKLRRKKVSKNNLHISTIEITWKKVRGNNVDFSTSEITPIKVPGNNVDFSPIEIISKKVGGNNVNFSTSVEKSTWKRRGFLDYQNYIKKVYGNDVEIR